jgi:exosortase A
VVLFLRTRGEAFQFRASDERTSTGISLLLLLKGILSERPSFHDLRRRFSWRSWILLLAGSAIVTLALFAHTAWEMVAQWYGSETFGHGFLVLPISLGLIWRRRDEVSRCQPRPTAPALVLVAILAALWLLAHMALAPVGEEFALVAMFPALVWLLLGSCVVKRLLFPLLFLFFMVPMGDSLVPPLQDIAAWFAVKGLDLVRVPVVLEGRLISVPSGIWEVAKACSGLRFAIAAVMLGCLFAYLFYKSRRRQIIFVLSALVFSVVANGVRVFGVILLGQLVSIKVASGADHLIYGWILFTLIIVVLFSVGWHWRESGKREAADEASVTRADAAAEMGGPNESARAHLSVGIALMAATLAVLASTSAFARRLDHASQAAPVLAHPAPLVLPPWRFAEGSADSWKPEFHGAASQLLETYSDDARQVSVFVAYYAQERPGAALVSDTNSLVNSGWTIIENGRAHSVVDGKPVAVDEAVVQSAAGDRRLVWSWYWVDGKFTENPYDAKLERVKALLLEGPKASAFIAVASDYVSDRADAEQALQDFLDHASFTGGLSEASR